MKYIIFILLFTFSSFSIFSETTNIIEEVNEYGGVTVERISSNSSVQGWIRMIDYYNSIDHLIVRIITPSQIITNERRIYMQINYYTNNNVEAYEIFFTEEHAGIHDYNKMVEVIGNDNLIVRTIWYYNTQIIDSNNHPNDPNRFQFYNLGFLGNEFKKMHQEMSQMPSDGDLFTMSQKYFAIKSVIRFDTVVYDLDNTDISILRARLSGLGSEHMIGLYTKKVRVFHNDNRNEYYWLYLQTSLVEPVKGQYATVRYYPISWNGNLRLICVGFYDL